MLPDRLGQMIVEPQRLILRQTGIKRTRKDPPDLRETGGDFPIFNETPESLSSLAGIVSEGRTDSIKRRYDDF